MLVMIVALNVGGAVVFVMVGGSGDGGSCIGSGGSGGSEGNGNAGSSSPTMKMLTARVPDAVSGPRTIFDHIQLYQRFVLGTTTLQPSYSNPT